MSEEKVSISTLAAGAVEERFNDGLQEVLANILDPNTNPKKKRKIVMTITLLPNEERSLSFVDCDVKTTIAPQKTVRTALYIGDDGKGRAVAAEMMKQAPGQAFIDNNGDIINLNRRAANK